MSKPLAILLAGLLALAGCSGAPGSSGATGVEENASQQTQSPAGGTTSFEQTPTPTPVPTPTPTPTPPPPELPGGGRELLPNYRLCGFVGYPGAYGQGQLGIGNVEDRMPELMAACAPYAGDRKIMPVMELITVTVMPDPGMDGLWRHRTDPAIIDHWLSVARQNNAMLLFDIQPGQSSFLEELKALEPYLVQPDVGVALDPEWAMGPGQIPMQSFGSTSGEELNEVAAYLSGLVAQHNLPHKVMLYHILNPEIISNEAALLPHPGVVLIKSVDGIGAPADKIATYDRVKAEVPPHVAMGFKLFYEEDVATSGVLMTPEEVLALSPVPDYIMYE